MNRGELDCFASLKRNFVYDIDIGWLFRLHERRVEG
jgi:hypothetical protein